MESVACLSEEQAVAFSGELNRIWEAALLHDAIERAVEQGLQGLDAFAAIRRDFVGTVVAAPTFVANGVGHSIADDLDRLGTKTAKQAAVKGRLFSLVMVSGWITSGVSLTNKGGRFPWRERLRNALTWAWNDGSAKPANVPNGRAWHMLRELTPIALGLQDPASAMTLSAFRKLRNRTVNQISRNLYAEQKGRIHREVSFNPDLHGTPPETTAPVQSSLIDDAEERGTITQAQATALRLWCRDLSSEEIAAEMGIQPANARQLVHRGTEKLKAKQNGGARTRRRKRA
jgi:DNA-binding CsgD family transcriptional regulator